MPMAKRLFGDGLKEVTLKYGLAGVEPNSPPTSIMSCHMRFESSETFMDAWPRFGEQLGGYIPNYTDITRVIQFSRIVPFA